MPENSAYGHLSFFRHRQFNILRQFSVMLIGNYANRNRWSADLVRCRKYSEGFHIHELGKRRQSRFFLRCANYVVSSNQHFRECRPVLLGVSCEISIRLQDFGLAKELDCLGGKYVTHLEFRAKRACKARGNTKIVLV